ncbi:MAG TPA: hypothetical protein PKC43_12855 [Phycisphaerales bacterium]|nr:hypothetical protein [Phycisphaerales bacterium]HMP38323.1 hypothetical protein [Phycisphaerales bacterium]
MNLLAILSTACGVLGTLSLLILCVAGAPNSSAAQAASIRLWAIATIIGGIAAVAGAIIFLRAGQPLAAAIVGGLPAAVVVALMAWVTIAHG